MANEVLGQRQNDGAARPRSAIVVVLSAVILLALAGALMLWAHYGTTMFFQMIAAGIAACF